MENLLKNRFNCFNLSTIGDGSIINFNNDSSSDEVVNVMAYPDFFQNYIQFNETHYQWCGPMLLIIEYLAKFTNTK